MFMTLILFVDSHVLQFFFAVLLRDLPIPDHMDRLRVLKLDQERKLKGDKGKSARGEKSLSGTTTSLAKGLTGGETPSKEKRPIGDVPAGREEEAKKEKKEGTTHSVVVVPEADIRGKAVVDLTTKGVPVGL